MFQWKRKLVPARQDELKSVDDTNTWTFVERQNLIPRKSVYKVKTKADASLEKYKARYLAKKFKQIEGIDYSETFATTTKPEFFRLIFSLATKENFILRQMDVKTAILHPKIKEEIYLEHLSGFDKLYPSKKTCLQVE